MDPLTGTGYPLSMTYSVMSTHSFAVLDDFGDEAAAQDVVSTALAEGHADSDDLMVMVFDNDGNVVQTLEDDELVTWAGLGTAAVGG